MSEFRSRPPTSDAETASADAASDPHPGSGSNTRDEAAPPRSSRHVESPSREGSVRGTRGHQSSGGADSPSRELSDGTRKGARKHRGGAAAGEEHLPAVTKKPHRRKPKATSSSSAASSSSPRSKAAAGSNVSGFEEQVSDSSKPVAEDGETK
ncbi:hypothetical protein ZIOFF_076221 [Zingiber officinale]|uniref:Uncharacterized protein n=2 Tax=Zingiber officinale TaxID=94328 RepID=A0A8J5BTS8_ZINOF|nr:hypothetical protein ZIOFF_076221 [Zingiber officinale]